MCMLHAMRSPPRTAGPQWPGMDLVASTPARRTPPSSDRGDRCQRSAAPAPPCPPPPPCFRTAPPRQTPTVVAPAAPRRRGPMQSPSCGQPARATWPSSPPPPRHRLRRSWHPQLRGGGARCRARRAGSPHTLLGRGGPSGPRARPDPLKAIAADLPLKASPHTAKAPHRSCVFVAVLSTYTRSTPYASLIINTAHSSNSSNAYEVIRGSTSTALSTVCLAIRIF